MEKHLLKEVITEPFCRECKSKTLHLYSVKGLEREKVKVCGVCAMRAIEEMEVFKLALGDNQNEFEYTNVRGKGRSIWTADPRRSGEGTRSQRSKRTGVGETSAETSGSGKPRGVEGTQEKGNCGCGKKVQNTT